MQSCKAGAFGLCIGLFFAIAPGFAADLAQRYRATLDFSEQMKGYEWTTGPEHIWRLSEFSYALKDAFRIKLGPSQVVFGCHASNVLWAAVFPDKPGEIVAAPQGKGEHVTSIWMRFHPANLGELFPERIVTGPGDPSILHRAKRLAAHKFFGSWHMGNLALIPIKKSINLDLETSDGPRRFFCSQDTETGKVEYVDAFRTHPLPASKPLGPKMAVEVFGKVWIAFDREYPMFVIKPQVDWAKLGETYRPRAADAKDNHELGTVISEMLDHLEDLHVYVQVDGTYIPGYNRPRLLNANPKALSRLVGKIVDAGRGLNWGRTSDGIGYIRVNQLSDDGLPETFFEALGQMGDTRGLILDLRYNGGGSEPLGCQIAGSFLDRACVYSLSQYRNGPKHTDLGPKNKRACAPAGPWHYAGQVVVLQGQKTMSSAESFALAMAQCPQVTTMGDRTAGSSANPRQVQVGAGIAVNLPRWIDMDPTGKPIDVVGIAPRVKIEAEAGDFHGDRDPVLAAALGHLRKRMTMENPPAGGVLQARPGVPSPKDRP
jgi:hypothetical protein